MCLSASYRAHLLSEEPNFWFDRFLEHEEKTHFFVFRNFKKMTLCEAFFGLFVCPRTTAYTVQPTDLKFGLVGQEQFFSKRIFLFLKILIFFRVIALNALYTFFIL